MDINTVQQIAARLLRHATAPYHEHAVRAEVESLCAEHGLECARDRFGNLFVRVWGRSRSRPLVLAAHMDHPGFEVVRRLSAMRWLARFRGSVPEGYFRRGVRVKLLPGNTGARLLRRVSAGEKMFELMADLACQDTPRFGVWDLPACSFRRGRIYARACDDIIGVAGVLATLVEIKRRRADVRVVGLLSRAEEVGFHGALAAADHARRKHESQNWAVVPTDSLVVSLETSRVLPGVKMGGGVVVRVGDKASIFHSGGSRFLTEVASGLQARNKGFRFQRALMSGGTCEATAFQEHGFECAAVCVPLGNYHNCGSQNRIQAEYVAAQDLVAMVNLLVSASLSMRQYRALVARLPLRLQGLLREARAQLPLSA